MADQYPCVFTKGQLGSNDCITFSIHVDDKFAACTSRALIDEVVKVLGDGGMIATVEIMTKVLGYGIKYTRYNPNVNGTGILIFDHSQYINDSFEATKGSLTYISHRTIRMSAQSTKDFYNQPDPVFCKERYKLFRTILGKRYPVVPT